MRQLALEASEYRPGTTVEVRQPSGEKDIFTLVCTTTGLEWHITEFTRVSDWASAKGLFRVAGQAETGGEDE